MNTLFKLSQLVLLFICFVCTSNVFAQNNNTNVTESGNPDKKRPNDDVYIRYMTSERRILEYKNLHEKDVLWEKRVWRLIDVREKKKSSFH